MGFIKRMVVSTILGYASLNLVFGGILPTGINDVTLNPIEAIKEFKTGWEQNAQAEKKALFSNPFDTRPAFDMLNKALSDVYAEVGIEYPQSGNFYTDSNQAMGAAMQQINDILLSELEACNPK